jgi:hypothetical protein
MRLWEEPPTLAQSPCRGCPRFYDAPVSNPASAAPSAGRRPTFARSVLIFGLFLLALVGTCELLGRFLPAVDPDIAAQCRYFAERKDKFDTIFIGSSRIRFHIDPKQFDAETAKLGAPTHSLNLAYQGMWPPESYYYLRQLLAARPRHLRWVFIEMIDYRFGQIEHIGISKRMMVWHDWKHTGMVGRRILESSEPADIKTVWLWRHAQCFLQRAADPGRGADWLRERYFPSKKMEESPMMKRGGFDPKPKVEWNEATREEFAKALQEFEQAPGLRVRPGLATAVSEVIAEVRAAGAEPILVLPPSTRLEEKLTDGLPPGVNVWAFNKPSEYPKLYLPELLHDPGHLNEDGAREFTRLLAERFAELTQKR